MANSDEKISKFVQAITAYAEEQRQKIHQEVEDFKAERLKQAEKDVLVDAYQLIQRERMELHNSLAREMSRRDMDARKQLLNRRREMTADIFAEATKKLLSYTATPAYEESLTHSMKEMCNTLPANDSIYYLAVKDAAHRDALAALCPAGSRIELSDDIRLGGLRGENRRTGIIMDDTLDTKLELQHEWFNEHSGLTVE